MKYVLSEEKIGKSSSFSVSKYLQYELKYVSNNYTSHLVSTHRFNSNFRNTEFVLLSYESGSLFEYITAYI